ncbi:ankyrin repeat-containing domain protein [Xylariaceae sp. FL0662B]|nr:ankyrin repeat-containing domain protein [Xylariaceae sp. FL0662B]
MVENMEVEHQTENLKHAVSQPEPQPEKHPDTTDQAGIQNHFEQFTPCPTSNGGDTSSRSNSSPFPANVETNTNSVQKEAEQYHHDTNDSHKTSSGSISSRQPPATRWGPLKPKIKDPQSSPWPRTKQNEKKSTRINVKPTSQLKVPKVKIEEPSTASKAGTAGERSKSKLSEANLRSLDSEDKPSSSPRTPKQRAAVPSINPSLFLKNTWESASSAATSVMSTNTRAKFAKLLLPFKTVDKMEDLLRKSCAEGKTSAVRTLLQHGCNPGTVKSPRAGPICAAVRGQSAKHNKCVRMLIEHGVDVDVRRKRDGKTPLHLAIENDNFPGYVKLIWLLVNNGADTNLPDHNGDRPLIKLFYGPDSLPLDQHRLKALAVLLNEETNVDLRLAGTGATPLHLAIRRQDKWAVAMLLHKGADVNAKNSSGTTPIQIVANQFRGELSPDHAQVLDLLLRRSSQHRVNTIDEAAGAFNRTPLHHAVTTGTPEAVAMLLKYGASPSVQDRDGCDAVKLAIQNVEKLVDADPPRLDEHVEIMTLLDHATSSKWPMKECKCVVELAFTKPDLSLLRELFNSGLDPNQKFRGTPLLHLAIKHRNIEAARLLVGMKAFIDDKNPDGLDAIAAAMAAGEKGLARHMRHHGRFRHQANKTQARDAS